MSPLYFSGLTKFTKSILSAKPIKIFNNGNMFRDFTYIDDIVNVFFKLLNKIPKRKSNIRLKNKVPFRVLNVGNNDPIELKKYVKYLEDELKKNTKKIKLPMQKGEVKRTHASLKNLKKVTNFKPNTKINTGIKKFVNWYNSYYKNEK